MIQYSEAPAIETKSRGVLDTPHARGMTRPEERRGWPGRPARRRASRFCPAMTKKRIVFNWLEEPEKVGCIESDSQDDAGSLGGTGDPLLPAVAPPSIGSAMPVIQRDSSLARNSAP